MTASNFYAIILAAGVGKRMKSDISKVLNKVGDKPMIKRTVETVQSVDPQQIIVVVNLSNEQNVKEVLEEHNVLYAVQESPKGTADAVKTALEKVPDSVSDIAVFYGDDTSFYKPETITKVYTLHKDKNAVITFITVYKENPTGLGRIVRENGKLAAIAEEKDATEEQKKIKEVNDGVYFFKKEWIAKNIAQLHPSQATGELYLTDLIEAALKENAKVETFMLEDSSQWHGINTPEELEEANRKLVKRIHIMGIAGAGAAAVAAIADANGFDVSGCDLNPDSAYAKNLENIPVEKNHNASHLKETQLVVISPAITKFDPQNPELVAAQEQHIPVITWQEFQGKYLQKDKFVITVAGAYGKSTTTSMISQIIIDAGLDPTCEIGAKVKKWGVNFQVGNSKYYICEADEYNNNFLHYEPDIAVILNIDWDHPDFFKTRQDVENSYRKFVDRMKPGGTLILGDRRELLQLESHRKDIAVVTVENFGELSLSIIGDFRKDNANAALTVAKVLGIDIARAKETVESFEGIGRRLEYKGEIDGVSVYDDYAVQPYTILQTANALKKKYKDKKVTLVLEPHTFSRIETFYGDFVDSLKNTEVDKIYLTNVYAAREKGDAQELSQKLAKTVGEKVQFTGSVKETAKFLKNNLKDIDIILSMGAGDIYKLYDLLKSSPR